MPEHPPRKLPTSRVKKGSNTFRYLAAIAVVLLLTGGGYIILRQNPSWLSPGHGDLANSDGGKNSAPHNLSSEDTPGGRRSLAQRNDEPFSQGDQGDTAEKENIPDSLIFPKLPDGQQTGQDGLTPSPEQYQRLINKLNDFYQHLDQQPYMQAFNLKEPSRVHFSRLIQKLVDNPPVVNRETDDLFTILKNTAHFFRILGRDNIVILKGILDREKDSLEDVLKTFYTLTLHPEYLEKEYSLTIPFESLYDYAGFFLNTMGGRLYLFRRDSNSRMAVSYYAILIVDRANSEGTGHHGINLKPAVDFLIEEIETGGSNLKMKEQYLDTLYDLKEKYN